MMTMTMSVPGGDVWSKPLKKLTNAESLLSIITLKLGQYMKHIAVNGNPGSIHGKAWRFFWEYCGLDASVHFAKHVLGRDHVSP
ncbi:hypothetical protein SAMN05660653_02210 [Desulfonatronum thiosulfatophilum]|uniref:Uncharacterized protein n=1 Tax=Desulfonatronum thiosulfatophilum TaxID=617002 RepID=A0A1G6DJT3_9BACT|nr:hypothetical protein [Desulfonatronum thiosulfatophilum]SDB45398.1 hypothetical protein SAMN05660653_02210 [Desulfonatronum thiosulfatophilum]